MLECGASARCRTTFDRTIFVRCLLRTLHSERRRDSHQTEPSLFTENRRGAAQQKKKQKKTKKQNVTAASPPHIMPLYLSNPLELQLGEGKLLRLPLFQGPPVPVPEDGSTPAAATAAVAMMRYCSSRGRQTSRRGHTEGVSPPGCVCVHNITRSFPIRMSGTLATR